jgi:hypothetical protein
MTDDIDGYTSVYEILNIINKEIKNVINIGVIGTASKTKTE